MVYTTSRHFHYAVFEKWQEGDVQLSYDLETYGTEENLQDLAYQIVQFAERQEANDTWQHTYRAFVKTCREPRQQVERECSCCYGSLVTAHCYGGENLLDKRR